MKQHTLAQDLEALLGEDHGIVVPLEEDAYEPVNAFAQRIATVSEGPVPMDSLRQMRMELLARFSSGEIGSLMSERILNRDQQLRTLSGIGPDVILDMMAEGLMLPRIAKRLEVAYGVLVEYMDLMCTQTQMARAESLSVDMMIDDAMEDMESTTLDREEISRRQKVLEASIKIGKAKSDKWVEKKPEQPTLIQNNFGNSMDSKSKTTADGRQIVHGFQLVMPSDDDAPVVKPIATPVKGPPKRPEIDPLIVNGEFELVPSKHE